MPSQPARSEPQTRYVALLRGINVGRAKRIAMADLRALFATLGFSEVSTLLNSGNVVYSGPAATEAGQAPRIQLAIAQELGVECLVIVKSAAELAAVLDGNPRFEGVSDPTRLLVALTHSTKALRALAEIPLNPVASEPFQVGEHAAYLWCSEGILQSKTAVALLKGLANSGTTRNWATLQKIRALL